MIISKPQNHRILVVDDESILREVIKISLEIFGYQVMTAKNGEEGLHTYKLHPEIDLIITDVNMPVMDGIDILCEIKKLNSTIPCIIMSGRPSQPKILQCKEEMIVALILEKPFNIPELQDAVESTLAVAV